MRTRAKGPASSAGRAEGRADAAGTVGSGDTWRKKLTAKVEESLVESGGFKPIEGAAGDEDQIHARREAELVGAEALAKAALGAGAGHGVAYRGTGSDEAGAGGRGRLLASGSGRGGRRSGGIASRLGAGGVIKHKGAAIVAAPLGADVVEIRRPTQVLVGAEAHGARPSGGTDPPAFLQTTVRRLRPFARRAARTLRPPLVALRAR